ncbi:MAG: DUF2147 domain-containing protein [Bacteroidia bacterium]|nr:DUF2147 domain-containing protein [Bacteroidia bacterium]
MRSIFILLAMLLALPSLSAQEVTAADKLIGVWEPSNGRARVKVDKIGNKYYGRIVWLVEPNDPETGQPKTDKNNPDEALRSVPLRGYRMLKDFEWENDKWVNGTIYDPLSGSTYDCIITMEDDNTLSIRGFVGVQTFGRTDVWKRLKIQK